MLGFSGGTPRVQLLTLLPRWRIACTRSSARNAIIGGLHDEPTAAGGADAGGGMPPLPPAPGDRSDGVASVASGNAGHGLWIAGDNCTVLAFRAGLLIDDTVLPNGRYGITVYHASSKVENTVLGGLVPSSAAIASGNGQHGVFQISNGGGCRL